MGAKKLKKMLKGFTILFGILSLILLVGSRTNHLMFVRGWSMYPTIRYGDLLILNKHESYNINDIVVFKNGNENYVKRIVYTGDDYYTVVSNPDGQSYAMLHPIQGSALKYSKIIPVYKLGFKFWMQGDGYGSINSDVYGPINKDQIIGKVDYILRI